MLKIRNWDKWQSYRKDRGQPPWIKIYRSLLRDVEWVSLRDHERGQLVAIWLLAADKDGKIPNDPDLVSKICFMTESLDLQLFIDKGFIENGDIVTPRRRQDDAPEKSRVEKSRVETEERQTPLTAVKAPTKRVNKKTPPSPPWGELSLPSEFDTEEFKTTFQDFWSHRLEIKKPMTTRAAIAMFKKLVPHGLEVALWSLNESISQGWQGVFPDKFPNANNNRPFQNQSRRGQASSEDELDVPF